MNSLSFLDLDVVGNKVYEELWDEVSTAKGDIYIMLKSFVDSNNKIVGEINEYSKNLTYDGKIECDPPHGTVFYVCKYNDCGWCYAPTDIATTSCNGQCNKIAECKGRF